MHSQFIFYLNCMETIHRQRKGVNHNNFGKHTAHICSMHARHEDASAKKENEEPRKCIMRSPENEFLCVIVCVSLATDAKQCS